MRQNYRISNAFLFVDYHYNNSQYNNYYTAVVGIAQQLSN